MFSHVTLGTNDWETAEPFWTAVTDALNIPVLFKRDGGIAYGELTGPKIFIGPAFDGQPASYGNGTHVAFIAKTRAMVDAFHKAALATGGSDEGAPGLRLYHPNYCLLYTSPSPRDRTRSRMPSSA